MTKNVEIDKVQAFLKTLEEQYPEQFVLAVIEYFKESKAITIVENSEKDEELEFFIRKNFDQYADVFNALA